MSLKTILIGAAAGLVALPALPAAGQSLSDRIDAVRSQRSQQRDQEGGKHSLRAMLGVLLYTDLDVSFEETPAREVISFLATRLDLNFIARYSDDRNADGFGIDPDTPITLKLEQAPALAVLEMALEQCSTYEEATWQMRRGYIEVGTKDRLSAPGARYAKVYPVDDLLFEPPRFDDAPVLGLDEIYRNRYLPYGINYGSGGTAYPGGSVLSPPGSSPNGRSKEEKGNELVDFIMENVEPMAWEANGGEWASIRYFDGALVIRAPDYIHRQIGGYPPPIKPASTAGSPIPAGGGTP
jgi:hypothetical protein